MSKIKCTGNNGNGCFMDSCGHDCGCEGIKESIYKHYKNSKTYLITNKCMIQVDDEWVDAVLYREEFGNQLFCREEKEFLEKFKLGE